MRFDSFRNKERILEQFIKYGALEDRVEIICRRLIISANEDFTRYTVEVLELVCLCVSTQEPLESG